MSVNRFFGEVNREVFNGGSALVRARLRRDVENFERRGGRIEVVPSGFSGQGMAGLVWNAPEAELSSQVSLHESTEEYGADAC